MRILVLLVLVLIQSFMMRGQEVALDDGLRMHLNFNANLTDQSASVNEGALSGAAYGIDRFGNCEFAMCFREYLQLVNMDGSAVDGLQDFSVSIWLRKDGNAFGTLLSAANTSRNNEINLNIHASGIVSSNIRNTAGVQGILISGSTKVDDGEWHHVVLTREGASGNTYLFVDKQQDAFKKMPLGVIEVNTAGFVLGNDQDCVSACYDSRQQFLGNLDDLRVYDRVINQAEIAALFDFEDGEVDTKVRGSFKELVSCRDRTTIEIERDFDSFMWNTGSTEPSIEVTQDGQYIVIGMIKDCEYKDTVNVTINTLPDLMITANETELACFGNIVINASAGFDEYIWQDGSGGASFSVVQAGVYKVLGISFCGEVVSNEIEITLNPLLSLEITAPSLTCGGTVTIVASEGFTDYQWSSGQTGQEIEVSAAGNYELIALDICGAAKRASIEVALDQGEPYFIPNTFTPNGDGKNETFEIDSRLTGSSIKIIDRWGKRVYASAVYENDWKGGDLNADVYYYIINGPCLEKPIKGWVKIMR